jgi:hypothetical protein
MVTKDKRQMPHVEANDSSPIIAPHLKDQQVTPEFVEKPPPKPSSRKSEEKIKEEKFTIAISRVVKMERQPEWRDMIRETPCFAKLWRDPDTDEYCEHVDCDLRQLCQTTWTSVLGGLEAHELSPMVTWSPRAKRKRPGRPRKEKVTKRSKWKGTGKYNRHPYQDTGRPIDTFAKSLWEFLGQPVSLPNSWKYPISKTKEQKEEAAKIFVEEYGCGLFVIRRASYHQYLFEGKHLLRLWTNAGGGGWLDCSYYFARLLTKNGKIDLVKTPASGYKTKFRFYPYRMFLGREKELDWVKEALKKIEGLIKITEE